MFLSLRTIAEKRAALFSGKFERFQQAPQGVFERQPTCSPVHPRIKEALVRSRTVAGHFFYPQSHTTSNFSVSLARAAFMALLLLLVPCAFAQTTVTLQTGLNSYAGTTDDWINAFS